MTSPKSPEAAAAEQDFSFALLSDRTGMARPGVFERAVEVTNMMRPAFAIQLGDLIEGYTTDRAILDRMWSEADQITGRLDAPLYRVPGNHDVGNGLMRAEWLRRHGPLHHHFRYRDVLFLLLDTQDPPQSVSEMMAPMKACGELPARAEALLDKADRVPAEQFVAELTALLNDDRTSLQGVFAAMKNGTQPVRIGEEQLAEMEAALAEHDDVRWTFVLMHMPAWQGEGNPGFARIRAALGSRPYTAFAGHCHNYRRSVIQGHDHVRLGPTGGARILETRDGDWDHITWVTMTPNGPRIANLVLDGVIGVEGGELSPTLRNG